MNELLNKCHACGECNCNELHSMISHGGRTGLKIVLLCDNCYSTLQGVLNRINKEEKTHERNNNSK